MGTLIRCAIVEGNKVVNVVESETLDVPGVRLVPIPEDKRLCEIGWILVVHEDGTEELTPPQGA